MADAPWPEITAFKASSKPELRLNGPSVQERLAANEGRLPDDLFAEEMVDRLQGLEVCEAALQRLPADIKRLANVRDLTLTGNALCVLPPELGCLTHLRILALSRNRLHSLPPALAELQGLQVLNISSNEFEEVPFVVPHLPGLVSLDCSSNRIAALPHSLGRLKRLSTLALGRNALTDLPAAVGALEALRALNVADNRLAQLPKELADCAKLKELDASGNPLADKKVGKLADGGPGKTKDVLKVLRGGSKSTAKAARRGAAEAEEEASRPPLQVWGGCSLEVVSRSATRSLRPYLVCCILRDLAMDDDSYRRFIQVQTELHEGAADNRALAALGTHDLDKLQGPFLYYESRAGGDIRFRPLKYEAEVTATELLRLFEEDAHMKRHLPLVEGATEFPFLMDARAQVLSLLPLVNSEYSKCSAATRHCFVECSSAVDFAACKRVMDGLLAQLHAEGILSAATPVEQVRVLDESGGLRVVYPSKVDLPGFGLRFR